MEKHFIPLTGLYSSETYYMSINAIEYMVGVKDEYGKEHTEIYTYTSAGRQMSVKETPSQILELCGQKGEEK